MPGGYNQRLAAQMPVKKPVLSDLVDHAPNAPHPSEFLPALPDAIKAPLTPLANAPAAPAPAAPHGVTPNSGGQIGSDWVNPPLPSYQDLYNQYAGQIPAQIQAIYAPQYKAIDAASAAAKAREANYSGQVHSLYDAYQKAIGHDAGGIKQNYANTLGANNAAYDQGTKSIQDAYSGTRNEEAAILRRLGVQDALPGVFARQDPTEHALLGQMISNKASQAGLVNSDRASALQYNNAMQQGAVGEGIGRQADLLRQLQDVLASNDQRKFGVESQQGQSTAQFQQQARSAAGSMLQNLITNAYNQQKLYDNNQYKTGRLDLGQGQLAEKQQHDQLTHQDNLARIQNKNEPDLQKWADVANLDYGNPVGAQNGMKAIKDALAQHNTETPTSAQQLIDWVLARNPRARQAGGDQSQLQDLSTDYYNRFISKR